jgi:hypothetical protein
MDRADFAVEVRREPLEQSIRDSERMKEARYGIAVVAAMERIEVATNGIRDLYRHRVDLDGYAERGKRVGELLEN